jgi:hypothetical protein
MQSAKLGTNKYGEWKKEKSSCNFLLTDQRSKNLRKNGKKCRLIATINQTGRMCGINIVRLVKMIESQNTCHET